MIFWDAGTAWLLPRLIGDRLEGLVFLAEHRPALGRARTTRDVDPASGRGRLSYDRAAALLDRATADERGGWNLHELRHSALTRSPRRPDGNPRPSDGIATPM